MNEKWSDFEKYVFRELSEIRKDVRTLMGFKTKLVGIASVAAFIATIIVEFIRR